MPHTPPAVAAGWPASGRDSIRSNSEALRGVCCTKDRAELARTKMTAISFCRKSWSVVRSLLMMMQPLFQAFYRGCVTFFPPMLFSPSGGAAVLCGS